MPSAVEACAAEHGSAASFDDVASAASGADGTYFVAYLVADPINNTDALGLSTDGMQGFAGLLGGGDDGNPRRGPRKRQLDPFDTIVDDYLVYDAAQKAAFFAKLDAGFDQVAFITMQIAQVHPAVAIAMASYNIATGNGSIYDVLEFAGAAGTVVGLVARSDRIADSINAARRGCNSFHADTAVITPDGLTRIADLEVGDLVLSRSDLDSLAEPEYRVVLAVFHGDTKPMLELRLSNGRGVRLTHDHILWAEGRGWVRAGELGVGDLLLGDDLTPVFVESVGSIDEPQRTYNLTVEGTYTYYAGGVWVHNCIVTGIPMPMREAKKLTKGHRGAYEAHHLIEKRHFDKGVFSGHHLDSPGVVLTRDDHKLITRRIRKALKYGKRHDPQKIKDAYRKVYAQEHPEWWAAIRAHLK